MILLLLMVNLAASPEGSAHTLSRRSIIEYNAGEFEKALVDATRAYELDPRPALLYDLGQCHRALHHWERAAFFFRGYLRENPSSRNRAPVAKLLSEMERRVEREAAVENMHQSAPTPPPTTPVAPEHLLVSPVKVEMLPTAHVAGGAVTTAPAATVTATEGPIAHSPSSLMWSLGATGLGAGLAGSIAWGIAGLDRAGYTGAGRQAAGVTYGLVNQSNAFALIGDILIPLGAVLLAGSVGSELFSKPTP